MEPNAVTLRGAALPEDTSRGTTLCSDTSRGTTLRSDASHRSDTSPPNVAASHGTTNLGRIEMIVGPMFCGKTTELARRMRRHQHGKRKVLLVKYASDTRYEVGSGREVVTHDAQRSAAHCAVRHLADVVVPPGTSVILVDEAQFMSDAVDVCSSWADAGYIVIVSALDSDFRRQPFPVTAGLIARAESVDKQTAVCMRCGGDAHWSHRTVVSDALELIGGDEAYEPLCRACWPRT